MLLLETKKITRTYISGGEKVTDPGDKVIVPVAQRERRREAI